MKSDDSGHHHMTKQPSEGTDPMRGDSSDSQTGNHPDQGHPASTSHHHMTTQSGGNDTAVVQPTGHDHSRPKPEAAPASHHAGGHSAEHEHPQPKAKSASASHDHSQPIAGTTQEHGSHADHPDHGRMIADFRKRFFISLILMVPVLLLSPMIQMFMGIHLRFAGDGFILFVLATILFFYGGKPFLLGVAPELKKKSPGMMTLIALSISVAYLYSSFSLLLFQGPEFFWELATLIVIMLLGHWIEMSSVMGASRALEELAKLMPEFAHLIGDHGDIIEVPVKQLANGDRILVKPGEKIPIDGLVYDGRSAVNEAMITGESLPVEKKPGDEVIGGALNGEGVVRFTVSRTGDETFLSQVIKMVRQAQESRSATQRLADVAAKWLFYIAVSTGIATFITWISLTGNIGFAMERAVSVVIIACPHALGLAVPLVTAVSTAIGAQRGILVRNRANFENARKIDTVVFDKTGTLTKGEFGVTDITAAGISEAELLEKAYALESQSGHPIAQGIVKAAEERGLKRQDVMDFQNITGQGLRGSVAGRLLRVVSPGYLESKQISFNQDDFENLAGQGKTVVFVLEEDILLGSIALGDTVRDTAKEAILALKKMNIESYMITGDNKKAAAYIGQQLEMDQVYAEVLPQEKAIEIGEIQRVGKMVAMIGDGINDAPALAKSDLGIAIGAGTDVAIETADIILVKSDPLDVVDIIKLSRATYRKMTQNLIWATAYNAVALPLAAGVLYNQGIVISPAMGAVLMSLSTVIVAVNARLLKMD